MPFFDKVRQADVFVLLTQAQFVKGNFHNRFYLDGKWNTMSVNSGAQPLSEKYYLRPEIDWNAIKARNPNYTLALEGFDHLVTASLTDFNCGVINLAAELCRITTPIFEEPAGMGRASERLVNLCHEYDADVYLSGPSGEKYLDLELFKSNGITVIFRPPGEGLALLEGIL